MLFPLKDLLLDAEKNNYALGAFNTPTLEAARAAIEAAEEMNAPIVLQHAEVHNEIVPIEIIGPILVQMAINTSVPVAVHLDHGSNFEFIKKAIEIGFSSVMIDASHFSFEENVRIVKEVVSYAHTRNVSVEAELGMMPNQEKGENEKNIHLKNLEDIYTDPDLAMEFVEKTNVDALAVSFGTVHGVYLKEPQLDFERLREIYEKTNIPIVMHGGSGLKKEDYIQSIENGVRKINYYTYVAIEGANSVISFIDKMKNEKILYHDLTLVAKEAMKEKIKDALKIFLNK